MRCGSWRKSVWRRRGREPGTEDTDVRRISFALTEAAFLDGSKDVTRRLGWKDLKPGTELLAVNKCMGLLTPSDVVREGSPGFTPEQFIDHFCDAMGCPPNTVVTRIEFERVA